MGDPKERRGRPRLKHPTAPTSIGLSVVLAAGVLFTSLFVLPSVPAQSREPDKTLKLYFGHTGEHGVFTFKRNGRYDRAQLDKINHFLRDWRRDATIHMDPHLLDLVWAIYQESGSHDEIHVVSAYRSPATNEMLRRRSSGVAKNSQHRLGKAMDWFVTDVPLAKLRGIAMKMQGGGVGYYPRSGSPFIHTDTGNVRAWPRMSRQQLLALFPNGHTLHLPADGKPLPGYEQAVAERKAEGTTALAYLETEPSTAEADRTGADAATRNWLSRVFPGTGDNEEDAVEEGPQSAPDSAPVAVATVEEGDVRVPRARPSTASDASSGTTIVAAADAEALQMLVMPALSSGGAPAGAKAVGIGAKPMPGAEDAIATLIAPANAAEAPGSSQPTQLAYASASRVPSAPSTADRAILMAFATVEGSDAVSEPDPTLVAALRGGTAIDPAQDDAEQSAIVLAAADLPEYDGDEDVLLDLIDASASADQVARFAMPEPENAAELFVAPGAASEVADLRGDAAPPVNRFASPQKSSDEQGFFTKLFASLIE